MMSKDDLMSECTKHDQRSLAVFLGTIGRIGNERVEPGTTAV
jgi:hypothetical protein